MPTKKQLKKQLKLKFVKTSRERFLGKIAFNPFTGCVMWGGGTSMGGGKNVPYGTFWNGKTSVRAHIWAYENIHGGIRQPGHHVHHTCHNSVCVHHLQLVTASENSRDGASTAQHSPKFWEGVPFYHPPQWCPNNIEWVLSPKEFYAFKRRIEGNKIK